MNDPYKYSNKPLTIIAELIAILLIINKLKFNSAFKMYENQLKVNQKKIKIIYIYWITTIVKVPVRFIFVFSLST